MSFPFRLLTPCLVVVVALASGLPRPARADRYDALRADPEMHNGLVIVAIANRFRDNCPDISARPIRGLAFLEGLVARARRLGYSRAEVEAFVDSDAGQAAYFALADRWLSQRGGSTDDPDSVCAVARREITAGSTIGRLLRGG